MSQYGCYPNPNCSDALQKYVAELFTDNSIKSDQMTLAFSRRMWRLFRSEGHDIAREVLKKRPEADGYVGEVSGVHCYIL